MKVYFLMILACFAFKTVSIKICNVRNQQCLSDAETEYDRWKCFGEYLFRKADYSHKNGVAKLDCRGQCIERS